MNNITKKELSEWIAEYEIKQIMEADIRKSVEEFKHFKRVDKRFTDRLTALGYRARITTDHSQKLFVSVGNVVLEVYSYGKSLSWHLLLEELTRLDFERQRQKYKGKLEAYDSDIRKLEKLQQYIKDLQLVCFDTWKFEQDLRRCINNEVN